MSIHHHHPLSEFLSTSKSKIKITMMVMVMMMISGFQDFDGYDHDDIQRNSEQQPKQQQPLPMSIILLPSPYIT